MKNSVSLLVVVAMTIAVVLIVLPETANAVCCHSISGRCGDCGKTSSHCGLKDCNVFGCNCDANADGDICRFGSCFDPPGNNIRPKHKVTGNDVLQRGDYNKDGRMTLEEARRLLGRTSYRNKRSASDAVAELDTNNDGLLTAQEIDN